MGRQLKNKESAILQENSKNCLVSKKSLQSQLL